MSAVLNAVTTPDCDHCGDRRLVWNQWAGKDIRCVHCTSAPKRLDPAPLRALSRADAERREQEAIDADEPKSVTGHVMTVALLYQWGRMVRDRGIGYPHMSTTEKARVGRGGGELDTPFPPDLAAVDRAVSLADTDYKTVLVEHYTKAGYVTEKAARLGISRQTYYVRKASAELHIANVIGA